MTSTRRRPIAIITAAPATLSLALANIAVYAAMVHAFAGRAWTHQDILDWGANVPELTLGGQYWRLVTCTFVHSGPLHIAINLFVILMLGWRLEATLGRTRFLATYALSGLAGSLAYAAFGQDGIASVGASGCTFGLIGACAVLAFRRFEGYSRVAATGDIVLLMSTGLLMQVDWRAHAGGLLAGILVTLSAPKPVPRP